MMTENLEALIPNRFCKVCFRYNDFPFFTHHIAGDVTFGGGLLREADGHFNDDRKPKGFNTKQIFVSPSMKYSGVAAYAKPAW